uniref:Signal-transducing adaptor protein 2-like n=1 Tax=Labrus bergylta TaxID=56723 RepID=A0A3Q3EJV0_9LABR
MAKRTGRPRSQLPTCYYEGYLEKKSFKDKYVEKLDLSGFMSITDDCTQDRNLDAARINLQMKDGNIKFTAPNAEARELWKGFIHSVAELSLPTSLNLLPGQLHMLREAVEQEKERRKSVPPPVTDSSPYVSLKANKPACYQDVSRMEAELLLDREAARGNLLLRPGGGNGNSFAVTTRQDLDGAVFRHYRVTCQHEGGFSIDVDNPVPCGSLHDVIDYLVGKTNGVLIPLTFEGTYERQISFICSDSENGEKSVQQAPSNLEPPSLPPKPVSRIATPEAAPAVVEEEDLYLNVQLEEKERETVDSTEVPPPPPKRAVMPPVSAACKWLSSTSAPSSSRDQKMRLLTEASGQIPLATISELKLKLEQKAMCLE